MHCTSFCATFTGKLSPQRIPSGAIDSPRRYQFSGSPRSIPWADVRKLLDSVDRRSALGKRDYAILLLLVTYGLRACEVANLKLDDIDWKRERADGQRAQGGAQHRLSSLEAVGEAIIDYLKHVDARRSMIAIFSCVPWLHDCPWHLARSPIV